MISRRHMIAAALFLAGCDTELPKEDPLKGLANVTADSVPADAPAHVELPVALVPSQSSAATLAAYDQFMATSPVTRAMVPSDILAEGDPRRFVTSAVGVLRRRFPKLELADDLATARARGFRSSLVLDLHEHHLVTAFDTNHAIITLVVMNAAQNPVSRIVAEGTSRTTYGSMNPHWGEAVDAAARVFEDKISRLLT
jgi:hypothetical protein